MKVETLSRAAFWICVAIILYLSLVPGEMRPHALASGHLEHFAAYAGTGFLFAPGSSLRERCLAAFGLAALSGTMEIAQLWIPGRTGEFAGFVFSSLGAWTGLIAGSLAWSLKSARRLESA